VYEATILGNDTVKEYSLGDKFNSFDDACAAMDQELARLNAILTPECMKTVKWVVAIESTY
jgi:hypothetical protein